MPQFIYTAMDAAGKEQKQQAPAGAALAASLAGVDEDDGEDGGAEADDLHHGGHFPEEDDGNHHGYQQTQLHEDGGQHHAVALCVGLEQTKAGGEQKSVQHTQTQGGGQAGICRKQIGKAGMGRCQQQTHQVIRCQHAGLTFDPPGT